MSTLGLAVVALFVVGFGLVSKRIQTTVVTAPMVFVLFGVAIGPGGFGLLDVALDSPAVRLLAELTLVLVLFTDAARIDLVRLRREHNIPVRLLGIGLPLTVLVGTLTGVALLSELTLWEALVLAVILAPTDAALGQAVVSSSRVPVRIRQALNVESGLNDGLALPFLLFRFALFQVVLGPVVGAAVGYFGGRLVSWGGRREWMSDAFRDLAALGLALLAYAGAEVVGGNGFIAAFTAGLTLGNTARSLCSSLYEFAEAEGQLLMLLSFLVFGAVMVGPALDGLGLASVFYALSSLTLVRMVPVWLSLTGLGLEPATRAFLGWFGPRGIASILYGLLLLEGSQLDHQGAVFGVTMLTILLSVFLHGITAWPGVRWYGGWAESMKDEPDQPEMRPVSEMPVRLPYDESQGRV